MLKEIDKTGSYVRAVVSGLGEYSLKDTLECGQCFRYERISDGKLADEYLICAGGRIIHVGQNTRGELVFFDFEDNIVPSEVRELFALDVSLASIKESIIQRTSSEWLKNAADCGEGIAILKQDAWETLVSFIISQNNNIPRIRKIIKQICIEYGENLAISEGREKCPLSAERGTPCKEICSKCGVCYSFPTAADILSYPEGLLPSHPGFRYGYILDAAEKVASGEVDLADIESHGSYEYTLSELKRIKGVGDKVASCVALFGFANLEAFPIDVWMKRAIDTYFDGHLDPTELGEYAGVAQQYIFHYIRNIQEM